MSTSEAVDVSAASTSATAGSGLGDEELSVPDLEDRNAALDGEADALLAELASSQHAVQELLLQQRQQSSQLGGLKDHLAAELQELQDEAWRMQVYAELEVLKRQMGELTTLEADIDRAEGLLDDLEGGASVAASTAAMAGASAAVSEANGQPAVAAASRTGLSGPSPAAAASTLPGGASTGSANDWVVVDGAAADGTEDGGGGEEEDDDDDDDAAVTAEEYEALQSQLDAELEAMYAQLQLVKAEAAAVATRKAELETELLTLLQAEASELRERMESAAADPSFQAELQTLSEQKEGREEHEVERLAVFGQGREEAEATATGPEQGEQEAVAE